MAVPKQTPYIEHTGNGVTTSFALKFQCESKDHLIVLVDDVEPPIASWSLTGGNVVFTTAPASGRKITLQRNTPFSRNTDYQSYNNSFRPPAVNKDFDWIWWKLQELGVADWILSNRIEALKRYVDLKDDELRAYLMEEIRKQGVALDQLDDYYNYLMQRLAQIAVDRGWSADFVVTADGSSQQQVNDKQATLNTLLSNREVFIDDYFAGSGVLRPVSDLYTQGTSIYNEKFTNLESVRAVLTAVTDVDDPLDWAAAQTAVDNNQAVRAMAKFYYFGKKTLVIQGNCSQFLGSGLRTRIYSDAAIGIKGKDGERRVHGYYGDFYLLGSNLEGSIGFDASAFSYNTFRNIWIRLFNDGWYADGSITPINKQYSNNTIINVRSNNNLNAGFRFVGGPIANSANIYLGCEGSANKRGWDEQYGYSNECYGCTFQGNTEYEFYSNGNLNEYNFYTEGPSKPVYLDTRSYSNKLRVRSSFPLWNTFKDMGINNTKSVRNELSVDIHVFKNTYFENWMGVSPAGILPNGEIIYSFFADANLDKGGGLQVTFNAAFQGLVIHNLDSSFDYAGKWVTVEFEADTSGVSDLSGLRIYTRYGTAINDKNGAYAIDSFTQTANGKYKRFTYDVKFSDAILGTPSLLFYLAYSGVTTSNIIKFKSIKVILGQKDRVSENALSILPTSTVSANFISAASGLNTAFKKAGRMVYNSTTGKVYYASSATATSAWKALDGTADIIPA